MTRTPARMNSSRWLALTVGRNDVASVGLRDAENTHQQVVQPEQQQDEHRNHRDVDAVHLAVVQGVDPRAQTGAVVEVSTLQAPPLRREVTAQDVAELRFGQDGEQHRYAQHPREAARLAEAGGEEHRQQVDDDEQDEGLGGPQLDASGVAADAAGEPPVGPEDDHHHARDEQHHERDHRQEPQRVQERVPVAGHLFDHRVPQATDERMLVAGWNDWGVHGNASFAEC